MAILLGEFAQALLGEGTVMRRPNFEQDMFVILTSSCARFMPSRRGYSRVSLNQDSARGGRGRRNEDEDRLIDNLDEEWDD
jgi:cation-dependent mannose-6-phosphate receptor